MNKKDKLFEMMEKLNPDFTINELYDNATQNSQVTTLQQNIAQPQTTQIKPTIDKSQPKQSMDATAVDKLTQKSSQLKSYSSRIDTPKEFQESFLNWFKTTGFVTSGKKISVAQALSMVKAAMTSLGFK